MKRIYLSVTLFVAFIALIFPSQIYAQEGDLLLANEAAITSSAVISTNEWFGQVFTFESQTRFVVTEFSFRYGSAAKVGTTAGIYNVVAGLPDFNLPFCATTAGAWALDEEGGAHDWWFFDLTALDCDFIVPFQEYAILAKNNSAGLDWQQAKYNNTDPYAGGAGYDNGAVIILPGSPSGDFLFRIYGLEDLVEVPTLFLMAYVGLAMITVSLLLTLFGSPMIGILAVNSLIFLMAVGLEWIPQYMLIVVMMGIGVIILMGNQRQSESS